MELDASILYEKIGKGRAAQVRIYDLRYAYARY
jgi:hypothetical protein